MQDEQDLSKEQKPFVPAVDPEKLTEGKIFWVETEDGRMINLGNVLSLSTRQEPWRIEADLVNAEKVIIATFESEKDAKQALWLLMEDSEAHSQGRERPYAKINKKYDNDLVRYVNSRPTPDE